VTWDHILFRKIETIITTFFRNFTLTFARNVDYDSKIASEKKFKHLLSAMIAVKEMIKDDGKTYPLSQHGRER
jgi:hypothetical protein